MGDQTPERWTLRGLGGGRQVLATGGPRIVLHERVEVVRADLYEQAIRELELEKALALSVISERDDLEAERDRYREALEFYANPETWGQGGCAWGQSWTLADGVNRQDRWVDKGKCARAALSVSSVEGDDPPPAEAMRMLGPETYKRLGELADQPAPAATPEGGEDRG